MPETKLKAHQSTPARNTGHLTLVPPFPENPRVFTPPGPGSWSLDTAHHKRSLTSYYGELSSKAVTQGFAEGFEKYGLPLDTLEVRLVNQFAYNHIRPLGGQSEKGLPPKWIFKILTRFHPLFRKRFAFASKCFEKRVWRADLGSWDQVVKPDLIAGHRALLKTDPSLLAREELIAHLNKCYQNVEKSIFIHHKFNVTAFIPVGDFLAHAQDWTGMQITDLVQLFQGFSPISSGIAGSELKILAQLAHETPEAKKLLFSNLEPSQLLEELQSYKDPIGTAARNYIEAVGCILSNGYDICEPSYLEKPEVIVAAIQAQFNDLQKPNLSASTSTAMTLPLTETVRERVPSSYREQFDQLLTEARLIYRLRDERGLYCDLMALGIARKAILRAGDLLVKDGLLDHAELLIDANHPEIVSLLSSGKGPTREELQTRATWRLTTTCSGAPKLLGPPPSAPPPIDWFPRPVRRSLRAFESYLNQLFAEGKSNGQGKILRGFPIGSGSVDGIARVICDPSDFGKLKKGDIAIAVTTNATFNVLLPILGGIVTEQGGVLSHAAIVAREYGIPGVVGAQDATRLLKDGMRVRVDGIKGEITVLE